MRYLKMLLIALFPLLCTFANAETAQELAVKKKLEPRLGENFPIAAVKKTPYAGLFEVRIGNEIVYTDEKAQFLFQGSVIDTTTRINLTRERVEEISRIPFSELPLELAIKYVRGDGSRVIAIFEDPNCGYCKVFRKTLQDVDNITVYTFMYNILAEDSAVKSQNIWCAPDKVKAWDDWMLRHIEAPAAPAGCESPNEKVYALGHAIRVSSTPTVFFKDGSRVSGAMDAATLEKKFAKVK